MVLHELRCHKRSRFDVVETAGEKIYVQARYAERIGAWIQPHNAVRPSIVDQMKHERPSLASRLDNRDRAVVDAVQRLGTTHLEGQAQLLVE